MISRVLLEFASLKWLVRASIHGLSATIAELSAAADNNSERS